MSSLTYTSNTTHISIHTRIPILSFKNSFSLYEFVPIPTKIHKKVHILNADAKVYFKDNTEKIKAMSPQVLGLCKQLYNHTICDSILHESLEDMDKCMASIVRNDKLSPHCTFKEMEERNYFAELTPQTVFCFITKPIQFRIVCNEQERIYNLMESVEIDFSDQCVLHKVLNELLYNGKTFSTTETNQILIKPNFSIYNTQSNNWTDNVKFYNQYNISLN